MGVANGDFDNDGETDLHLAHGRVRLGAGGDADPDPYAEPNSLRRGCGQGRFEDVLPAGGTLPIIVGTSRGLAAGDLDNDGAIDLIIIEKDAPLTVLRNRVGQGRHWIQFNLRDSAGRDVRNAVLQLEGGGRVQWRQHQANEGYCSSQDPRSHFGLGNQMDAVRLRVRWPDGKAEQFDALAVDRLHQIQAGHGTFISQAFTW